MQAHTTAACSTSYAGFTPVASAHWRRPAPQQHWAAPYTAPQPAACSSTAPTGSKCSGLSSCRARCHRATQCSAAKRPPVRDGEEQAPAAAATSASNKWLDGIAKRWRKLSPQQQVYAAIAGLVLSAVLWQLLTLGVVLLERLLLGSLIAAEEALLSVLAVGLGLFLVFTAVNALGVGAYLLGGGRDEQKPGGH